MTPLNRRETRVQPVEPIESGVERYDGRVLASLSVLIVSCALALWAVARGRLPRFEAIGVALFIVVVACVGVGGALSRALHDDVLADGRALIGCAVGPLMALVWRGALAGRLGSMLIGMASTLLLVLGLAGQSLAIVALPQSPPVVAASLLAALVASTASAVQAWRLGRLQPSRVLQARPQTEAAGALSFALSSLSALWTLTAHQPVAPGQGSTPLWPALCALGVVLVAQSRVGRLPLQDKDVVGVVVAAVLMVVALPLQQAALAAVVAATALVLGAALLRAPSSSSSSSSSSVSVSVSSVSSSTVPLDSVGMLVPLLDDAIQRRPLRPRIFSRTSARRLVEAAVERAWRCQPQLSSSSRRAPVDVQQVGDDVDVDGDVAELAEALCAVIDNALRHRAGRGDGRVSVVVRAATHTVGFEVDDVVAADVGSDVDGARARRRPFLDAAPIKDGERPGYGVSLARARLLVERHGGQLHVRSGADGGVHITVPRRLSRGPVGLA
jgi:hypothetical protein